MISIHIDLKGRGRIGNLIMEEMNISIDREIKYMQKKDNFMKIFNIILTVALLVIVVMILIHKVYLKENTYSILKNDIVNSEETVTINSKDIEKSETGDLYYIEFSNNRISNKIYVNEGVYEECNVGDSIKVFVKDIYDKKGNILKEELLFNIND